MIKCPKCAGTVIQRYQTEQVITRWKSTKKGLLQMDDSPELVSIESIDEYRCDSCDEELSFAECDNEPTLGVSEKPAQ